MRRISIARLSQSRRVLRHVLHMRNRPTDHATSEVCRDGDVGLMEADVIIAEDPREAVTALLLLVWEAGVVPGSLAQVGGYRF
ncbi:hypothetical protein BTJ68_15567 [Hortaea werneckii EXF-2000]|uniref:Uncharacterized protein n=1 Tax=Hortaea werneckii EXF-2000 TaxID=1157616 RepID=A0A1Z5SLC7_HORWE|nr:hypothetical protein BTJ68_15567 [Hortaea werneckii EXF-2000]